MRPEADEATRAAVKATPVACADYLRTWEEMN